MPQIQTIDRGTIYIVNVFHLDVLIIKNNKKKTYNQQTPIENFHSL